MRLHRCPIIQKENTEEHVYQLQPRERWECPHSRVQGLRAMLSLGILPLWFKVGSWVIDPLGCMVSHVKNGSCPHWSIPSCLLSFVTLLFHLKLFVPCIQSWKCFMTARCHDRFYVKFRKRISLHSIFFNGSCCVCRFWVDDWDTNRVYSSLFKELPVWLGRLNS